MATSAQDDYVKSLLHADEAVLAIVPIRWQRNLWTHVGRLLLSFFSGGVVLMNKDFADMVVTTKRLIFAPALVAFEAPLVPLVRSEVPKIIPRSDILDVRFRQRWMPARYLWGDKLTLHTRQGILNFSIDRDDTVKARNAVRFLEDKG